MERDIKPLDKEVEYAKYPFSTGCQLDEYVCYRSCCDEAYQAVVCWITACKLLLVNAGDEWFTYWFDATIHKLDCIAVLGCTFCPWAVPNGFFTRAQYQPKVSKMFKLNIQFFDKQVVNIFEEYYCGNKLFGSKFCTWIL